MRVSEGTRTIEKWKKPLTDINRRISLLELQRDKLWAYAEIAKVPAEVGKQC
jgi:hypothetical protein